MRLLMISFLAIASAEFDIEPYIHGGEEAMNAQIPYQVGLCTLLNETAKVICGGSLISSKYILTAAHCIDFPVPACNTTVYLGSKYLFEGNRRIAHRKIIHSKWTGNEFKNGSDWFDIGLLQISKVCYTEYIKKIDLPPLSNSYPDYEGHVAISSGWGRTTNTSGLSPTLQYAELVVISSAECEKAYGGLSLPRNVLCAVDPIKAALCNGDSGGPLVVKESKTLIGIASFVPGNVGCTHHLGNAYTRVTSFRQWIKDETGI